jgi:hypothetical protein
MTEHDPLDRLSRVANQSERPATEFSDRLLDELLGDLTADESTQATLPADFTNNEPTLEVMMLAPERNQLPNRSRTWMLAAASVAAIALIGGLVIAGNREEPAPPADLPVPIAEPTAPVTEPAESDLDPSEDSAVTKAPSDNEVANAPLGPDFVGQDRSNPVPSGSLVHAGDGFRLQVLSVKNDATQEVLDRFEFISPPPAGFRYTLVSLAGGYYGLDDPQSYFLNVAPAPYSNDGELIDLQQACGPFPQFLGAFGVFPGVEMFSGGVITGELCVLTTPAESEGLLFETGGNVTDTDRTFFEATEEMAPVIEMPTLAGIQPGTAAQDARQNPTPIGTPAEVSDTGWSITVTGAAQDITDTILDAGSGNAAPPDGFRFVAVPVSMANATNTGAGGRPTSLDTRAVGDSNVQYDNGCGVVPGALDDFTMVDPGGTVKGQLCLVVPTNEIDSILLHAGTSGTGPNSTGPYTADLFFATRTSE